MAWITVFFLLCAAFLIVLAGAVSLSDDLANPRNAWPWADRYLEKRTCKGCTACACRTHRNTKHEVDV